MEQKPDDILVRIKRLDMTRVNDWRRQQEKIPSVAEAVRQLVKRGLAATEAERAA